MPVLGVHGWHQQLQLEGAVSSEGETGILHDFNACLLSVSN